VDATLYEARAQVGGRTRSVSGVFAPGFAFDEGAQLVNTDHEDLRGLIRELGLKLVDRRGYGPAHEIQIGRDGRAVPEAALADALRPIAARITADSDRLDRDYEGVARELDALSVKDYLDRHGLAPGDARDALEAGVRTEYGAEPHEASALELVFNLPTVDGARLTRISVSDERYLVEGGTGRIAQALGTRLRPFIRTGVRLSGIDMTGPRVRLAFAGGAEVVADRVILALPAPLLRELRIEGALPPLWREMIGEVRLGRNEKLIAGYDGQAWRGPMGFAGALWAARDFSAVWDAGSGVPSRPDAPGALTYFLGGDQVDAARAQEAGALASRFTTAAQAVVPGLPATNGKVRRTRWCEDPLTGGAYINYRPGQLTRFASLMTVEEKGSARASRAGPLLFAGEFLSDAFPGYMNGAVQTGRIAADAAMEAVAAAAA
jgi:monoamine oxidase